MLTGHSCHKWMLLNQHSLGMLRMDQQCISKVALTWTPHEKKKPGRPKSSWRRTTSSELSHMNLTSCQAQHAGNDRQRWRQIVAALCSSWDEEEYNKKISLTICRIAIYSMSLHKSVFSIQTATGNHQCHHKNERRLYIKSMHFCNWIVFPACFLFLLPLQTGEGTAHSEKPSTTPSHTDISKLFVKYQ